jgi:hypothetical protein
MAVDFHSVFQRALPYAEFLQAYATPEHQARWKTAYDAVRLTEGQRELLGSFRRKMNVLCMAGPWCGDCVNACTIYQHFAEQSLLIDLRFINRAQNFDASAVSFPAATPKPGTAEDPEDIRSRPIGKILVKWGVLTPERVDKALLEQEEQKAKGLNVRIGDVMAGLGYITGAQRDQALAAQSGYDNFAAWDHAVAKELSICGAPRVPMLVFLSEDGYECGRFGERTLVTYREKVKKLLASKEGASCSTGLFPPEGDVVAANIAEWLGYFERIQWMLVTSGRLMKLHGEV